MRSLLIATLAFSNLVLVAPVSYAGNSSGGGGSAMVCRDVSGAITSAQLLDLVEASQQFGLEVLSDDSKPEFQVGDVASKLLPSSKVYKLFMTNVAKVEKNMRFLSRDFGLQPIDDSYPVITPSSPNCRFEQLANYDINGNIVVVKQIYDHLDNTNRAALLAHEAIYKIERTYKETTNSIHSRKIVALLFSEGTYEDIQQELPEIVGNGAPKEGVYVGHDKNPNRNISLTNVSITNIITEDEVYAFTYSILGKKTESFNFVCKSRNVCTCDKIEDRISITHNGADVFTVSAYGESAIFELKH